MIVDTFTITTTLIASITALYINFESISVWLICHFVRGRLVFPKTSQFNELNNKPLTKLSVNTFSDVSMTQTIYNEIRKDPNLKIYGKTNEVISIFKTLFYDRNEILLNAMDYIVISKMGMELVILQNEKRGRYNRSLWIEVASYRQAIFNLHLIASIVTGTIAFIVCGSEKARDIIAEKAFFFCL